MKIVTQLKLNERTQKFLWSKEFQHDGQTLMEVQSDEFLLTNRAAFKDQYEYASNRALKELMADVRFTSLMLQK